MKEHILVVNAVDEYFRRNGIEAEGTLVPAEGRDGLEGADFQFRQIVNLRTHIILQQLPKDKPITQERLIRAIDRLGVN